MRSASSSACVRANVDRCGAHAESTISLATALNPYVGYDAAAKVAQEAQATGKKVQEVVREHAILSEEEMRRVWGGKIRPYL
jgi:aspartate ammonia-lyase